MLVQLTSLFMICVLSARFAVLLEHDLFCRVDFVSGRNVILGFT